jgi:hypothetical protein
MIPATSLRKPSPNAKGAHMGKGVSGLAVDGTGPRCRICGWRAYLSLPLLACVLLAGCNSNSALSKDEYAERLINICGDIGDSIPTIAEPETAGEASEIVATISDAAASAADRLDRLSPPDEWSKTHSSIIEGMNAVSERTTQLADLYQSVQLGTAFSDDVAAEEDRLLSELEEAFHQLGDPAMEDILGNQYGDGSGTDCFFSLHFS